MMQINLYYHHYYQTLIGKSIFKPGDLCVTASLDIWVPFSKIWDEG